MRGVLKQCIAVLLIVVIVIGAGGVADASDSKIDLLGNLMDNYKISEESFELTSDSRIFIISEQEPEEELLDTIQLVQAQFAADSLPSDEGMEIVWGEELHVKEGDIVANLDFASGIISDGYHLEVGQTAKVTASNVRGLLYGLNMLQKFFRIADAKILPGFYAEDVPDTKERTVMLDCGRKYYTKDYICNFIREISWMGYNTIELHFSEDGGFRMDFWDPEYYTDTYHPENDFTWLCGGLSTSWVAAPYWQGEDENYLQAGEVIEILQTAKEYQIDVIPSFDSPAHCDYLTWAFEQNYLADTSYSFVNKGVEYQADTVNGCINYTQTTGRSEADDKWPEYASVDITNPVARAFVLQLYTDIADFFKEYSGSTKFNIGADEVALRYSVTWDYEDFPIYVNEIHDLLNEKGYTTRIFNDFIGTTSYAASTDFHSDIEILYWNSPFNPSSGKQSEALKPVTSFVEEGRTVYNVIGTNCYYCTRISSAGLDARDPANRQWQVYSSNEEDIYHDWYPADISEHGDYDEDLPDVSDPQLGGAYFCIWHDYQAMHTEVEIWNGAVDKNDSAKTYYLLNRMWSNTIKMWNWDVNITVEFSQFMQVRDALGHFPGYIPYTGEVAQAIVLQKEDTVSEAFKMRYPAMGFLTGFAQLFLALLK